MSFERRPDGRYVLKSIDRLGQETHTEAEEIVLRGYFARKRDGLHLVETLLRTPDVHLPTNAHIIDIGCGKGWLIRGIASSNFFDTDAQFVGIDIDSWMQTVWKEIESEEPLDPRIKLEIGDANSLEDFADGSIDLVTMTYVADQFPNEYGGLPNGTSTLSPFSIGETVFRVLKPTGVFYVRDMSITNEKSVIDILDQCGLRKIWNQGGAALFKKT